MSVKTLTLAKSLHTVSVLVNVARYVLPQTNDSADDVRSAVNRALCILGYDEASDPHGLVAKAIVIFTKELNAQRGSGRAAGTWDGMSERDGYC